MQSTKWLQKELVEKLLHYKNKMKTLRKALNRLMMNNTLCSLPTKSWKRNAKRSLQRYSLLDFYLNYGGIYSWRSYWNVRWARTAVVGAGLGAGIGGAAARKIRETNCK